MEKVLQKFTNVRITVFGDFAVDAYWEIETDDQPLSVETGLPTRRVLSQRYTLGGAGNVVANLAALGVGKVRVIGLSARDVFGIRLRQLLEEQGADVTGLVDADTHWQTPVYIKP